MSLNRFAVRAALVASVVLANIESLASANAASAIGACQPIFVPRGGSDKRSPPRYGDDTSHLGTRVKMTSARLEFTPLNKTDGPFLELLNSVHDIWWNFGLRNSLEPALGAFQINRAEDSESATPEYFYAAWIIRYEGRPVGMIQLRKQEPRYTPFSVQMKVRAHLSQRQLPNDTLLVSLGYVIHPDYRQRGFASEASDRITDFAKVTLGIPLIFPKTYPDNLASKRVLERSGYHSVATPDQSYFSWFANENLDSQ